MKEKPHELLLKRRVEGELGGWCIKLWSVWDTGLPDRMLLFPPARVEFVETKTREGKLEASQKRVRWKLRCLGFKYHVARSPDAVNALIDRWTGETK